MEVECDNGGRVRLIVEPAHAKLGLGLWNHFGLSVALELLLLAAGAAVYVRGRSRRHPLRAVRLGLVLLLLVGIYLASLFGPPPPSITAIGLGDVGLLLLVSLLGAWADRPASAAELASHPAR